jgi:hypothetical protein
MLQFSLDRATFAPEKIAYTHDLDLLVQSTEYAHRKSLMVIPAGRDMSYAQQRRNTN